MRNGESCHRNLKCCFKRPSRQNLLYSQTTLGKKIKKFKQIQYSAVKSCDARAPTFALNLLKIGVATTAKKI